MKVICIDAIGSDKRLVLGKCYEAEKKDDGSFLVADVAGCWFPERFKIVETKPKKSGVSIDRALRIKTSLLSHLKECVSLTRTCKLSHTKMCELFQERVYSRKEWKQAPRWVHEYLFGYKEAQIELLYRHEIEWRLFVDGVLLTSTAVHAIADNERSMAIPVSEGIWQRVDGDKSRHVWKSDPTKVF
jgi:hypothetical protein